MKLFTLSLACVFTVFAGGITEAVASIFLNETFDYASQADLNAAWSDNSGGSNSTYILDQTFGNPSPSYSMPSPSVNFVVPERRLGRNIGVVNGSDANPLHISFDLFLETAGAPNWSGARHFVELRGYENGALNDGALTGLVAAGVYNNSDDLFNTTYYQGRVVPAPLATPALTGWQTLNGEPGAMHRSTGWHNLDIEIRTSEILFSIDGILAEIATRQNTLDFDSVVLGSGLTAGGHDAWIDNVRVYNSDSGSVVVPEPFSLMVWVGLIAATVISTGRRTRS